MAGTATISVEIELGWGFHDGADPRDVRELSADGRAERAALAWFLEACDDAGVPVTFDVVGHLLLESCDGRHDGPHPDGWFARDPGTDAATDPLFYFPDVVETIRDADVDHEICTHTFSHVLLDEVGDEVVDWELDRVGELHDEAVVSLVPPRHRKPPYDVLRDHGIEVVRRADAERIPSGPIGRFRWTLGRDHPLDDVRTVDGLVETRTSPMMTLTSTALSKGVAPPHPAFRALPERFRRRRHEQYLRDGLERAIATDRHVHYWTHLYNLANEAQRGAVEAFLDAVERSRDDASLGVLRMADLADRPNR